MIRGKSTYILSLAATLAVGGMIWVGTAMFGATSPALAKSTSNLRWLDYYNSSFYNYDFTAQNQSSSGVDWPIRYLFRGANAEIDFVKDRIDGCGGDPSMATCWGDSGGPMHYMADYYDSSSNYHVYWDTDSGKKLHVWCAWNQGHVRFYADPSTDRDYNAYWGYYILASIHQDREGFGCPATSYSSTETVEQTLIDRVQYHLTSSPYNWSHGYVDYFQNPETGWANSDGWARQVNVGN